MSPLAKYPGPSDSSELMLMMAEKFIPADLAFRWQPVPVAATLEYLSLFSESAQGLFYKLTPHMQDPAILHLWG